MNAFFKHDIFIVNEKYAVFANTYDVSDEKGEKIGQIKEKLSTGMKILNLLIKKSMLPTHLEIHDPQGNTLATITRGFTFFLSKLAIFDEKGNQIAYIKQKLGLTVKLDVYDMNDNHLARIDGNWTAWDFDILDSAKKYIGQLTKKFDGFFKEVFTTKDKYMIRIEPSVTDETLRVAIVSTAAIVDLIAHEN